MGQYHLIANLDKRELLHPHQMGDGLKLLEFGSSGSGTMLGLAVLLAASNGPHGRGGGDFHIWDNTYDDGRDAYEGKEVKEGNKERDQQLVEAIVGRWAGDRIAIIGDYREDEDFPGFKAGSEDDPWVEKGAYTDISPSVWRVINLDYYIGQQNKERWRSSSSENEDPYTVLA